MFSLLRSLRFYGFAAMSRMYSLVGSLPPLEAPVFIVGVNRSGTRLLERLLMTGGTLASWSEANHVWEPHYYRSTDVSRPKQAIPGFTGKGIHAHEIPRHHEASLKDRVRRLFGLYTRLRGKRLLHRNPFNCLRVDLLDRWFEDPRIVHVFRDARAAVNSYVTKHRNKGLFSPEELVRQAVYRWDTCFETVRSFVADHPDNTIEVKYAQLSGPRSDRILETLFEFCDLPTEGRPWRDITVENRNSKWRESLEPDLVETIEQNVTDPSPEPLQPDR